MSASVVKDLRRMETALENERNQPPEGFPTREEAQAAMEHALSECARHKQDAHKRVHELLKEKGVIS
jgi:hypothetical protein